MRAPCPARCRCDFACKTQLLDLMSRTGSQPRLQRRLCARSGPRGRARAHAAASARADSSGTVTLENVRSSLIRQEDTIIFHMIERSQFARNDAVYTSGAVPVPAFNAAGQAFTFLEYLLRDTEAVHGRIRRYTSPDEHAFFPDALPPMVLPPIDYPDVLHSASASVNINPRILDLYLSTIMPGITRAGDDSNYGSSAMYDVLLLQALSKRIHYGMFVAEAKFRSSPEEYAPAIRAADAAALLATLTFPDQEDRVVARVRAKAATFGQDLDEGGAAKDAQYKVEPALVAELYRDWVMPLTKEVQVQYLLRRLDGEGSPGGE